MQYDLQLTANGSQRIEAEGTFFKYRSGVGMIRVTTSKGAVFDLMPGQGVSGLQFSALTIQDRSSAINTGVMLAGNFKFEDDTINGVMVVTGKVSTVDSSNDISTAGKAFMALQSAPNADPTSNDNLVIFSNPVGSVKNIFIDRIITSCPQVIPAGGGAVRMYMYNGIPTTASGSRAGPYSPAANKKIGAAASVARTYTDSMLSGMFMTYYAGAVQVSETGLAGPQTPNGTAIQNFEKPLMLSPGTSVVMSVGRIDGSRNTFEFREEPV